MAVKKITITTEDLKVDANLNDSETAQKTRKGICDYAKSKGDLGITLEVFDQEIDKKCLIGPAKDAKRVAEEVREEFNNFGLMA